MKCFFLRSYTEIRQIANFCVLRLALDASRSAVGSTDFIRWCLYLSTRRGPQSLEASGFVDTHTA